MATEIELKAHVENFENLKSLLSEKAEYLYAFEKDDTYWVPPLNISSGRIRLRSEKRVLADENVNSLILLTHKQKKVRDGIEINDEREFEISSPNQTADDFAELLRMMGLRPALVKRKRGWAYRRDKINAELINVENLGWFIELEILSGKRMPSTLNETDGTDGNDGNIDYERKQLLDFLSELGISKEAVESRYYSEMLGLADNPRFQ